MDAWLLCATLLLSVSVFAQVNRVPVIIPLPEHDLNSNCEICLRNCNSRTSGQYVSDCQLSCFKDCPALQSNCNGCTTNCQSGCTTQECKTSCIQNYCSSVCPQVETQPSSTGSTCSSCTSNCQAGCTTQQCKSSCVQNNCNSCQQSCNGGQNCNTCSGSSCCTSSCCNNCANSCQARCNTVNTAQCKDTCVQDCNKSCGGGSSNSNSTTNTNTSTNNKVNVYVPLNTTTIINLKNIINNTNIIRTPINVTNYNINRFEGKRGPESAPTYSNLTQKDIINIFLKKNCSQKIPQQRCCYVVHPVECYSIPEEPYQKCIQKRHRECSDICSSVVVHIVRVPQPIPYPYPVYLPGYRQRCHYVQQYPWVSCGHYGVQSCGSCYSCGGQYNPIGCRNTQSCHSLCRSGIYYVKNDHAAQGFIQQYAPFYSSPCASALPQGPFIYHPHRHGLHPGQQIPGHVIPSGGEISYPQSGDEHTQNIQVPGGGGCNQPGGCGQIPPVLGEPYAQRFGSQGQGQYYQQIQTGGCQSGGCAQAQVPFVPAPAQWQPVNSINGQQNSGCGQSGRCGQQQQSNPGPIYEQVHKIN